MLPTSHALAAVRGRLHAAVRAAVPCAVLIALLGPAAHAQTFFVDAQNGACSNSGPGTEAQPYCTISAALAAHKGPGITIVVKPGIYREQVTVPASGAAGLPFVFQAQGPRVVIDGADDFANVALWTPSLGTAFVAAGVTWTPKQVYVDGARIAATTSTPDAMPANSWTWVGGTGLIVNLGGDNPGAHETLVGRRNYGFNIFSKSFVTMDGFEITRTEDRGINMQNPCSDLIVSHNRVSFANSYGIQTVNGQRIVIDGNTVSDCNFHGIGLTAGATGCIVKNNDSFRNAHPTIRQANGIYLFGAPGNTISGNKLHENQDTGLNFAGSSNDCICFNNRSWANGDHGYDHLQTTGTIHVNDVAYGNVMDGFSFEGDAGGAQLHNCIAIENGVTRNEFDLWVDANSSVGFVSDHNLFWNSGPQNPIKFVATQYATLAAYQAASGQDAHSKQADPRFVNGPAADFRLLAGSPAIDAAASNVADWPATDAAGAARQDDPLTPDSGEGSCTFGDLGALEFVPPPVDHAPTVACPSLVKTSKGKLVTFNVTASDADGDAIQSLVMVPVKMPANSGATFTPNATNTGGTFSWAPGKATGTFSVRFVAANALQGSATTSIQIAAGKAKATSGDEGDPAGVPVIAMSQGYPNPSWGDVSFTLDLPEASDVDLSVFDTQGRRVWQASRSFGAGRAMLSWDGRSTGRQRMGTGIYLVRAQVGETVLVRRVIRF